MFMNTLKLIFVSFALSDGGWEKFASRSGGKWGFIKVKVYVSAPCGVRLAAMLAKVIYENKAFSFESKTFSLIALYDDFHQPRPPRSLNSECRWADATHVNAREHGKINNMQHLSPAA